MIQQLENIINKIKEKYKKPQEDYIGIGACDYSTIKRLYK